MQYKKMNSINNPFSLTEKEHNYVCINMIDPITKKKTANRRIINIHINGVQVMDIDLRYKTGKRYVEWFKL